MFHASYFQTTFKQYGEIYLPTFTCKVSYRCEHLFVFNLCNHRPHIRYNDVNKAEKSLFNLKSCIKSTTTKRI